MTSDASVLIVDDDPGTRETLADVLELRGYAVTTAASGQAGLDVVQSRRVDVAILDIKLPDVSGLDLLGRIKRTSEGTEVIVVTAYGSVDTAMTAINGAALAYVPKPFEMDHLLGLVDKAREAAEARRGAV